MHPLKPLAAAALLALAFAGCGGSSGHPANPRPTAKHTKVSLLFSHTADSGTLTAGKNGTQTLTLRGVEEQTVWFQDRPGRGAGQLGTDDFVRAWDKLGFTEDAPNAALSLLDAADKEDTLIVELEHRPSYDPKHGTLRYTVRVLHNTPKVAGLDSDRSIPYHFNDASLFIDDVICFSGIVGGAVVPGSVIDLTGTGSVGSGSGSGSRRAPTCITRP